VYIYIYTRGALKKLREFFYFAGSECRLFLLLYAPWSVWHNFRPYSLFNFLAAAPKIGRIFTRFTSGISVSEIYFRVIFRTRLVYLSVRFDGRSKRHSLRDFSFGTRQGRLPGRLEEPLRISERTCPSHSVHGSAVTTYPKEAGYIYIYLLLFRTDVENDRRIWRRRNVARPSKATAK